MWKLDGWRHWMCKGALAGVVAGAAVGVGAQPPAAPPAAHWSTSWFAAPEPAWGPAFVVPPGMPAQVENVTLRQALRLSVGGRRIRLMVSNAHGAGPLQLGRAGVATTGMAGAPVPVRFQGREAIVVAAGAQALSDPVDLPVADGERLRVDLYLPAATAVAGYHWDARERGWLIPGDATDTAGSAAPATGTPLDSRAFLGAVLVESAHRPAAVVTLGDSITDGNGATPGADRRWPDQLARRLAPEGVAVLNAGISGNRLLRHGMGESALSRLQRDVLSHPGVCAVVVLLGTNDIGWPGGPFAPHEALPAAGDIARGFEQLAGQLHLRGVRVIGATLPPFEDALKGTPLEGHYSAPKEAVRQSLNAWIRDRGPFDAVVDFDRVLRDPARPSRLLPAFDSGDHLHPGDAGYAAMAAAIPLRELSGWCASP